MSRPKVLATDLDGTLLRSDGTLSDRSRAAIAAADAAGVVTVFVTARPPRWLDELSDVVGAHGVAICGNGAFVLDLTERRVVQTRGFDPALLPDLVERLRGVVPDIAFAVERSDGMGREHGFLDPTGQDFGRLDLGSPHLQPVGKLLAVSESLRSRPFIEAVTEAIGGDAEIGFSGMKGLAEMTAPGVTKASGLSAWCDEHGFTAAEVWACGDMPNDLPMLHWAGRAFAVANAHDDVRAAADEVIATNDDDAVAQVLERLL